MDQGQALVGLPRTSQGFSSDSRKLPSKLNREVSGKVKKASKGVQYPLFGGEKGSNDERGGLFL